MVHYGEFLKTWSLRSNSVTRQITFNRAKISRNAPFSSNMNHALNGFIPLNDSNSAIFGDFQSKTESIRKCEIFSTFYFRYHFAELIVIKPFWQSALVVHGLFHNPRQFSLLLCYLSAIFFLPFSSKYLISKRL